MCIIWEEDCSNERKSKQMEMTQTAHLTCRTQQRMELCGYFLREIFFFFSVHTCDSGVGCVPCKLLHFPFTWQELEGHKGEEHKRGGTPASWWQSRSPGEGGPE